jgi:hypothetical protein
MAALVDQIRLAHNAKASEPRPEMRPEETLQQLTLVE